MAKTQISKSDRIKRRKRRRRQLTGLLFTILVVVGIVSIVSVLTGYAARLFDNSGEKEEYEALIAPLVALDPTTFSSLENANQSTLMEAAVWAALNNNDLTNFSRNEDGLIQLPDTEVALYAAKMYGPAFEIKHRTFTSIDMTYEYNGSTKVYTIPITSQSNSYTPVIEKITTSGNTKILLVAYMQQSSTSADMILNPDQMYVAKYREYVMIRNSGEYYLYSIREPETTPESAQ
jgi:hypothetical protein